jgi:phage host-nuclease inhibitor protein Gam
MSDFKNDTTQRLDRIEFQNKQDHQQIIQAVKDLDKEVQRLDTEVVQIKRIK